MARGEFVCSYSFVGSIVIEPISNLAITTYYEHLLNR